MDKPGWMVWVGVAAVVGCNGDPCLDDGPAWQQSGKNCPVTTDTGTGTGTSTGGGPGTDDTTTTPEPTTSTTVTPTSDATSTTTSTTDVGTTGTTGTTTAETTETTDTDTSTTTPPPTCGDGTVDDGEECDDGDQDDTNACTNACTNAACGDGIVGPGEACDDGNKEDGDECSNACALASCGDGTVQMGEECDDGDDDDTDECLSTCKTAVCGDMAVQAAVEECDDGNDDETDMCTSACKLPTCDDGAVNGSETDVDCGGGGCPKCAYDDMCAVSSDCESDLCAGGLCKYFKSCQAILDAIDGAPSGIYTIDPAGDGKTPLTVYCDQVTDGGGWTMLFKLSSGVAGDPSVLWSGPALNEDDMSLLGPAKSTKHYVSSYIEKFWNLNGVVITDVRAHAYVGGNLDKFWKFNGALSDELSWFAYLRLVGSSYIDILPLFNHFSIAGETTAGRRFHINRSYNGCPNDLGWLTVDTAPDPCSWEINNAAAVRIIYPKGNMIINWTNEVNAKTVGVGDVFAVFVR